MKRKEIGAPTGETKQVLGLVGSPRKLGNCEVFLKEISRNIPEPHTLKLIRMPSLRIEPCLACYQCIMDNACPHADDMENLLQAIVDSDAVIMTSPVYFLGAHSIYKRILDRGFLVYQYLRKTAYKPCVLVNTFGLRERIGVAPQAMLTLASYLVLDVKASVNVKAALPGEILETKKNMELAKRLGRLLFSGDKPIRGKGCPFCGCEIVRMADRVFICTLCHGSFTVDPQGTPLPLKKGPVLGDPDHMFLHKRWLQGMKEKFLGRKKSSLRLLIPYKDMGEWIRFPGEGGKKG